MTRRYGLKRPEAPGKPSFDVGYPGVLKEQQLRVVARAKDLLYLLYPIRIFDRGTRSYLTRPSRFVASIPEKILESWAAIPEADLLEGAL